MLEQEQKRSGCLTAFLILMLILNSLSGLYYLLPVGFIMVQQVFPSSMSDWMIPMLGLLSLANFVFALAIWKWKKWGIYGFAVSTFIAIVINISIGIPIIMALFGLLGIVILVILLRPVWSYLE